jgi:hypothetical protein
MDLHITVISFTAENILLTKLNSTMNKTMRFIAMILLLAGTMSIGCCKKKWW